MKNSDPYLKEAKIKDKILEFCQQKNNEREIINTTIIWAKLFDKSKSMTQPKIRDYLDAISDDGYLKSDDVTDFIYNIKADPFLESGGYVSKYKKDKNNEWWKTENEKISFVKSLVWLILSFAAMVYTLIDIGIKLFS